MNTAVLPTAVENLIVNGRKTLAERTARRLYRKGSRCTKAYGKRRLEQAIAEALGITLDTTKKHVRNVMEVCGVQDEYSPAIGLARESRKRIAPTEVGWNPAGQNRDLGTDAPINAKIVVTAANAKAIEMSITISSIASLASIAETPIFQQHGSIAIRQPLPPLPGDQPIAKRLGVRDWAVQALKGLLVLVIGIGGLAYIVHYISTLATIPTGGNVPSPLDLAATSGTIGGLLLVGAFAKQNIDSQNKLKRIGKWFLAAAVFFTIAFLLLEWARIDTSNDLNAWERAMTWVSATAIVFGIGSLAKALAELVLSLPRL